MRDKFKEAKVFGEIEKDQFFCYVQHKPNGDPFYVGKGFKQRHFACHNHNEKYIRAVKKYKKANIETYIFPVESEYFSFRFEEDLIYMFRCQGFDLANFTDGGEGPSGRKQPKEEKERRANSNRGKKRSEETKKLLSAKAQEREELRRGWTHTDEARKLISEAGYRQDPYKRTPEILKKQSESRIALYASGFVSGNKGNKFNHPEERKARMKLSQQLRREREKALKAQQQQ